MTIHRQAIETLIATGDHAAAFAIARTDETMSQDATLAAWSTFADRCIANEAACVAAYADAA
jgi:hypothetical protein